MTADTSSIPGYYLQFASDNAAGVCPEALAAMNDANSGFAASYGNDDATKLVCDRLRELFETDAEVFFVFNGTAANSVTLAALCQPYQAVICTDTSHVETDECGAPEFFSSGSKLLLSPHRQGKLTSAGVLEVVEDHQGDNYRAFYTVVKFAAPQRPPKVLLKERAAPLRARSNASPTSRATLFGSSFPLEESRRGNDRPAARGGVARLVGPFGRSYQRRRFRASSKY